MINKETKNFKFNNMIWRLKAKIDKNDDDSLQIYLRNIAQNSLNKEKETEYNENVIDIEVENSNNENNDDESLLKFERKEIVSFYYRLEYEKKQLQKEFILKNLNNNSNNEILIAKLMPEEWESYRKNEIFFTIFLNLDPTHSTILLYLAENLKEIINKDDISIISLDDMISLIKYLDLKTESDTLFLAIIKWGNKLNNFYLISNY